MQCTVCKHTFDGYRRETCPRCGTRIVRVERDDETFASSVSNVIPSFDPPSTPSYAPPSTLDSPSFESGGGDSGGGGSSGDF